VPSSADDVRRLRGALATFAIIFLLIWCGLYAAQGALRYVRSGATLIREAKLRAESSPHLFKKPGAIDVLYFGNSKALSGFVPAVFDSAMEAAGREVESYNLGLPGDSLFVDRLSAIIAAGNVPKYILVTVMWPPDDPPSDFFHFIRHDALWMDRLFPFRFFPRDLMMFATSSPDPAAAIRAWRNNRRTIEQMLSDRGYFFIYDSSRFPNDELPASYRTQLDQPATVNQREANTQEREFQKLNRLLVDHKIYCLLVPTYYRAGEYAPPPTINTTLQTELSPYSHLIVTGPDYVLFDNRDFSDRTHLNRDGAVKYTRYLADLVAPVIH
jgi:hypothetical protein